MGAFRTLAWVWMVVVPSLVWARDDCGSYCPIFTMEQSLKRFRDSVDVLYSGQEDAIAAISQALMTNMIDNANALVAHTAGVAAVRRVKPLLLHFTGPTGVGKTLMAQLIKEALFVSDCGVKKIHLDVGYKYASASQQRERIDAMKKDVVTQLEHCPRSLIIFDDFQWAPEMMILSLRDAFDESTEALAFREKRASTSRAVFVFCSDLESEQRHLKEEMSMEQARSKVSELAGMQWKMVDQTSAFGRLFLSSDGMVPFVPLSEPELRKVIHIEMGKLTPRLERHLSYSASNHSVEFAWLGRVRWNEKRLDPKVLGLLKDDLNEYNARAIRNLMERHLLAYASTVGKCLVAHSARSVHKGWLWGETVNLLDDVKVDDLKPDHAFRISVGGVDCAPAQQLGVTLGWASSDDGADGRERGVGTRVQTPQERELQQREQQQREAAAARSSEAAAVRAAEAAAEAARAAAYARAAEAAARKEAAAAAALSGDTGTGAGTRGTIQVSFEPDKDL